LAWRAEFANETVNRLHAEAFAHGPVDRDWRSQVAAHSLGWVCASDAQGHLVGFANVPWDGDQHAFLVDVAVGREFRRRGVGTRMVMLAAEHAHARGCAWLHVDFEAGALARFYVDACGFVPTAAGLLRLGAG